MLEDKEFYDFVTSKIAPGRVGQDRLASIAPANSTVTNSWTSRLFPYPPPDLLNRYPTHYGKRGLLPMTPVSASPPSSLWLSPSIPPRTS